MDATITLVENDDVDTLKDHIDRGLNVNQTHHVRTLLYVACQYDSPKCAKLLIEEGADMQQASTIYPGGSPLHIACRSNHIECADILLNAGADMYRTDNVGDTAFYDACVTNSVECVELLLRNNIDVNKALGDIDFRQHLYDTKDKIKQLIAPYLKI